MKAKLELENAFIATLETRHCERGYEGFFAKAFIWSWAPFEGSLCTPEPDLAKGPVRYAYEVPPCGVPYGAHWVKRSSTDQNPNSGEEVFTEEEAMEKLVASLRKEFGSSIIIILK